MNFKQVKPYEVNENPDYVWYDLVFSNIDSENFDSRTTLFFKDTRDVPIINKIDDYKMSITRFEISTWSIPCAYFQSQTNSNDPNIGQYGIVLEYFDGVNSYTTSLNRLIFVPQDKTQSTPPAPNTQQYGLPEFSPYYYIYNFNNFIDMVNTAFSSAMVELKTIVGGIDPSIYNVNDPFMVWNDDLTASILAPADWFDVSVDPQIKIYFNRPLYSIFNSFPSYKLPINSNGKHYQILMNSRNGYNTETIVSVSPVKYIVLKQEFQTYEALTPFDSIVFTTSQIPVIPSINSAPTVLQNGQQLYYNESRNQSETVISDFQSSENNFRSTVFYIPSASYRYISLTNSDKPLYNIDVYAYLKDKTGKLRDFPLPSNSRASMKILFEKKVKSMN